MKLRLLSPVIAVVLLAAAGCGGGGSSTKLTADDVAVVGTQHITQTEFDSALAEAKASMKDSGQSVPSPGSTGYATMRTNVVNGLVQFAEFQLEAAKLGISVKPKQLDAQLVTFKKSCCKGSETKYTKLLKQQGFTDDQLRGQLQQRLLEQKLYDAVTKSAKATDAEIVAYYTQNISQYKVAASRDVLEILVGKNKKALANQLYAQLQGGANFGALAKKYSQDPGSKNQGGKFTANQGSDVPEFDAAVFAETAKTGVLLKPVSTAQYGWFLIKPTSAVKPAKTTTEKEAAASIRKQLNSTKQQDAAQAWLTTTQKKYCSGSQIAYQSGYTPSPDLCTALDAPNPTTT